MIMFIVRQSVPLHDYDFPQTTFAALFVKIQLPEQPQHKKDWQASMRGETNFLDICPTKGADAITDLTKVEEVSECQDMLP